MRIVALDPGGTTGMAMTDDKGISVSGAESARNQFNASWQIHHMGPEEHHKELYQGLMLTRPDVIVCESFEFRQGSQRANINLMSKEYIGVVKLYRDVTKTPVVFQTAAAGKG